MGTDSAEGRGPTEPQRCAEHFTLDCRLCASGRGLSCYLCGDEHTDERHAALHREHAERQVEGALSGRGPSCDDAYDSIEYEVRCPRDGKLRGRADTYEQASTYAARRDKSCGMCYPSHGAHVVLRRWVTQWEKAPARTAE